MRKKIVHFLVHSCVQIFTFIVISYSGSAQVTNCDEHKNAVNSHSQALLNFDTTGASAIAKKYLSETGACKCTGYFLTTWNQIDKKDTAATIKTLGAYTAYLSQIKADSSLFAYYYTVMARSNIFLHADYAEALSYQLRAMSIFEKNKDTAFYLQNLMWSLVTWYRLKEIPLLLSYRSKAKQLLLSISDYPRKPELLCILSSLYYLQLDKEPAPATSLDSAILIAQIGLDKARIFNNSIAELDALSALSAIYSKRNDYIMELAYLDSVLQKAQPYKHDKAIAGAYQSISAYYRRQEKFVLASQYADSSLPYFRRYKSPTLLASALFTQYKAHKAAGNYKTALIALEERVQINDSLLTLEKSKKINELEKKYNQSKNETIILELKQKQQWFLIFAIVGLLASTVAAFIVRQKNMQQKQKILEAEQRLNRARMNPHFFFNALASLQQLALRKGEEAQLASNLSKFSHIMRDTLESTYKEFVTLEDEMDFLQQYLSLQQMRLAHRFEYSIETGTEIEIAEVAVPPMIIQPFVENAIEHGFSNTGEKGYLSVNFKQEKMNLIITIEDNGSGMQEKSKTTEHISRATQIIKDRLYLLNTSLHTKASFSVKNKGNEKGVQVLINLPLLYRDDVRMLSKISA